MQSCLPLAAHGATDPLLYLLLVYLLERGAMVTLLCQHSALYLPSGGLKLLQPAINPTVCQPWQSPLATAGYCLVLRGNWPVERQLCRWRRLTLGIPPCSLTLSPIKSLHCDRLTCCLQKKAKGSWSLYTFPGDNHLSISLLT